MKIKLASAKKFVADHRIALTVTATSTFWIWMMVGIANEHNDFLKEHDLYDTYYYSEED